MKPRVSMADVARRAGVSRTTASYVLNDRLDVSIPERTRSLVVRAAAELGYRPNSIARSLVSRKTSTIGVVVPSLDGAFQAAIVNGIQEECASRGYRLLLAYSRNNPEVERQQVQLLLENQVEGVICISSCETCERVQGWLRDVLDGGFACTIVDHHYPGTAVDAVVSQDRPGAVVAVQHLIERGHRRIAHVSGGPKASSSVDRLAGYRDALSGAGLAFDPALVVGDSFVCPALPSWIDSLFSLAEPPTAIFAANDDLAAETHLSLRRRGLRIPEDVALVGFGNQPVARYLDLTTVDQAPESLGRVAACRLFDRIDRPDLPTETIRESTRLLVRASSGAARNGR